MGFSKVVMSRVVGNSTLQDWFLFSKSLTVFDMFFTNPWAYELFHVFVQVCEYVMVLLWICLWVFREYTILIRFGPVFDAIAMRHWDGFDILIRLQAPPGLVLIRACYVFDMVPAELLSEPCIPALTRVEHRNHIQNHKKTWAAGKPESQQNYIRIINIVVE